MSSSKRPEKWSVVGVSSGGSWLEGRHESEESAVLEAADKAAFANRYRLPYSFKVKERVGA